MFGWLLCCGFGFRDDISVEVLVQDHFACSIRCCLHHSFSGYHISGVVNCLGQWIVYEVLLNQSAIRNEFAGSGSVTNLLSFLFQNVNENQVSEFTEMVQTWLPPMPGLI